MISCSKKSVTAVEDINSGMPKIWTKTWISKEARKDKEKISTGNQEGLIWKRYTRYHHLRTSEVSGPTLWPVWSGSSKYTFKMLGLWENNKNKIRKYRTKISLTVNHLVFNFFTFEIHKIVVMEMQRISFCSKVVGNQNCCWMLPLNQ